MKQELLEVKSLAKMENSVKGLKDKAEEISEDKKQKNCRCC